MVRGIVVEVVIFICRTEKSQGIVTAQIEQETMRVTRPDFLRPASIIECIRNCTK